MDISGAWDGLALVVGSEALAYLVLGVLLGLFFGAVPGLSGLVGMAILLPFTIGMGPAPAFAFLIGMYAVTTTSDTLASVMLGVPGTAASQATVLDGYPLAQKGQAARALGAAFTVSACGGVLGAVILALSLPLVEPLTLAISDPEYFALGILGMTMVGSLAGGSMLKGLAAASFGLLLASVGFAEFSGQPRYTFGFTYLLDGIPLLPLVLGLFAIPEILDLAVSNRSISRVGRNMARSGMLAGVKDAFVHWWLGLRSTFIGVYVGMLPGLGGAIVDWVAYGHAVQSARDKSRFGKGDIRGVIAPEAANNAMKGGALLPTIAFAIPGSASMAILLGAFTMQGLQPGPQMLLGNIDITFSLIWSLALANLLGALALLVWGNQVAKLTFVSGHLLVPAVLLFTFMGAWVERSAIGDWVLLLCFGALGYFMKKGGWSRPPLVLGFILGGIMESALHLSAQTHGAGSFQRPIVLFLAALFVMTVVLAVRRHRKSRVAVKDTESAVGEGAAQHAPALSLPVTLLVFATACFAGVTASGWSYGSKLFPLIVVAMALPLAGAALIGDIRNLSEVRAGGTTALRAVTRDETVAVLKFALLLSSVLLLTFLIGQFLALIAFVAAYLLMWGRVGVKISAVYAAAMAAVLYLLFEKIVPVIWHPSPFFTFP